MNLLLFRENRDGKAVPVLPRTHLSQSPTGGAPGWRERIRQAYENLQERLSHEERICSNLRRVETLVVIHPASLPPEQAQKKLRDFLKLGYSKHRAWFWIDAILAVLGVSLFWFPGPNVFFFYPAARALSHRFAQTGAKQALAVSWSFQEEPLMDQIEEGVASGAEIDPAIATLEQRYDIDNLQKQLRTLQTG